MSKEEIKNQRNINTVNYLRWMYKKIVREQRNFQFNNIQNREILELQDEYQQDTGFFVPEEFELF